MHVFSEVERKILTVLLSECESSQQFVGAKRFRANHFEDIGAIDELIRKRFIIQEQERYRVSVTALHQLNTSRARVLLERAEKMWVVYKNHYLTNLEAPLPLRVVADQCSLELSDAQSTLTYMLQVPWSGGYIGSAERLYEAVLVTESILKFKTFSECVEDMASWNTIPPQFERPNLFPETNVPLNQEKKSQTVPIDLPSWLEKAPENVQVLVREIYEAKNVRLLALSAMGVRAVIDMVSLDKLDKDYGNFSEKLKRLRDEGHMTAVQHDALAAVVDAGSAAAHRGFIPDMESVEMMVTALNHLLQSLYVLENSSRELSTKTPVRKKPDSKNSQKG